MKTVVFSQAIHDGAMKAVGDKFNVVIANSKVTAEYVDKLKDAEGVVLRMGLFGRDILDACPKLEVIARPGVGVDTIDMGEATRRGIPVVIAPGANLRSVAEHTIALLYAITKNVVEGHNEVVKGNYDIRNKGVAVELGGRKAGVAGFGAIGREVAKLLKANGMDVVVYDPFVKKEAVEDMGYAHAANLEALLAQSRILTLHLPSSPETRGMIGGEELALLPKGAFLINCARGDIIDGGALYDVLADGSLAGAAVDVMVDEPMNPKHRLFSLPNFIATAHSAAATQEAYAAVGKLVADGVIATLSGERWPHVFNPDAYKHPKWAR